MKKLTVLLLFFFSCSFVNANSIDITFNAPLNNQVVDSSLHIQATVNSTFQVSSVVATIEGRQVNLNYVDLFMPYDGTISLAGLQQAVPLQLTVTVTDVFNTQQSASITVFYVKLPKVNLIYPAYQSNLYPSFRVKANAISIDPDCRLKVHLEIFGVVTFDFVVNSPVIDTVLIVPPAFRISCATSLTVSAIDSWNQERGSSIDVFFNDNIYLSEIYTATSPIMDFKDGKVLFRDGAAGKIYDISTHDETTMTGADFNGVLTGVNNGMLTPYGAIYFERTYSYEGPVYEWNNGVVYTIAANSHFNVYTSGKWATFWGTGGLTRRNLATHTNDWTHNPLPNEWSYMNDIDSSGTVVYKTVDSLLRYRNNQLGPLSTGNGYYYCYYPTIDREYTAYLKRSSSAYTSINMHDGTSEILLSDFGEFSPGWIVAEQDAPYYYQTKNRYVTYVKKDANDHFQVWIRDSSGASSQRSFFNAGSSIDLLNSKGDVMYQYYDGTVSYLSHRYLAKNGPL